MMKLIGSRMEREIEAQLRASQSSLLNDPDQQLLRTLLTRTFGDLRSAMVVGWTPDQGEDFYSILVNGSAFACFEVPREPEAVLDLAAIEVKVIHPVDWKKHLRGKPNNLTYLIAMKIARETLGSDPLTIEREERRSQGNT
ncbi:hypothetical protein [Microvirga terricola]|uniref:Uncharacterized protein n=1 Tax=Microvirga terricola TaxID=2719797 RepID=A0ABX0VB11_9HYPH|nr:hypothetical protein [Microvirga terricola]NIX76251.1 hypothetical protein [Microvirga terricola]